MKVRAIMFCLIINISSKNEITKKIVCADGIYEIFTDKYLLLCNGFFKDITILMHNDDKELWTISCRSVERSDFNRYVTSKQKFELNICCIF